MYIGAEKHTLIEGDNSQMGRLKLAFQYDESYVISASHPKCEALVLATLKEAEVEPKGSGYHSYTKRQYLNLFGCFDIETTKIDTIKQSIMYVWQYQLGPKLTIIGRTWEEFLDLLQFIKKNIPEKVFLCNFIHNASHEFQYLTGVYHFKPEEVFCIKPRKVLKFDMYDCFEFRCSMLHSNMGLLLYTTKMQVKHIKQDGKKYDYKIKRYPWTPLSKDELKYQIHDVLGLYEALSKEMYMDGDNLASFPLTSTGYVRRDIKKAVRENVPYSYIQNQLPTLTLIREMEDAFRGGDTHANRHFSNKILKNVKSVDRSSSYPDVQVNCMYPVSRFIRAKEQTFDKLNELIRKGRAVLFRVKLYDLQMIDDTFPDPYLTKDKAKISGKDKHLTLINPVIDNGRVLSAAYLETTVTDVDWKIITKIYKFNADLSEVYDMYSARYGFLPDAYRDVIIWYYEQKTKLKGDKAQEVFYEKFKNKLNAIYGCSAQHVLRVLYYFAADDEKRYLEKEIDENEELMKSYRQAFSSYAWGLWTTAWARFRLFEGMMLIHQTPNAYLIYWDTDSLKYIGTVDFSEYNKQRIFDSSMNKAVAIDATGKQHAMGVFEEESDKFAVRFITMGAKKYAYETISEGNIDLHITIAGVNKKDGAEELAELGGLDAMKVGTTFVKAGGTKVFYNDLEKPMYIRIQNHTLKITSNLLIEDDVYTLGISDDYKRILSNFEDEYLDLELDDVC